jgi:hypothetical protein
MKEKIKLLYSTCKAGVLISINEHRNYYETIEENIGNKLDGINPAVLCKMKELDTLIVIQFYPDIPIGFYLVYHYDLELAIDETLELLKSKK